MKIWNKKILNKAATFLLTAVLLCWNALQVEAYTADTSMTGYPYVKPDMYFTAFGYPGGNFTNLGFFLGVQQEQNSYHFNLSDNMQGVEQIRIGNENFDFIYPFEPDVYDYYVVGTFAYTDNEQNYYLPINGGLRMFYSDDLYYASDFLDFDVYDFNTKSLDGFSFSGKIDVKYSTSFTDIFFVAPDGILSGDVFFCASVIPVAKGSEAEQLNQSILYELIKINQNLVTSNSLQQSTIDAINQHDANEKSWFQQLIQSMGIGFSTLYEQMKKEQDDKLYGYQDTTTSEAASVFSSESDKLTALEGELSTQSNTYVTDYAAEGFDLGVLATLGSSLIFVTTWFTNFWNMGGVFTACLNFCFALSIVFFILRIKR